MSLQEKPRVITLYNYSAFFNFQKISSGAIRPGQLLQFRYQSPEGVHDVRPLIFVLEKKGDRVWGCNLHYNFKLLPPLLKLKDDEVQKFLKSSSEYRKWEQEMSKPKPEEVAKEDIPDAEEVKETMPQDKKEEGEVQQFDIKKVRFPQNLLEDYTNNKIVIPSDLLRNYLFVRMSGLEKLLYKV